jgi:hypothetical protein
MGIKTAIIFFIMPLLLLVIFLLILIDNPSRIHLKTSSPSSIGCSASCVHHIDRKRIAINLHRPLGIIKLDFASLNSRLDLLSEDFAIIGRMRPRIMPLAIPSLA